MKNRIYLDNCCFNRPYDDQAYLTIRLESEAKDALHLACAVTANCDYFLTTDKGILNKRVDAVTIINPIDFVRTLGV
jgi:predicted nucleic acid-binding protein